MMRTCGVCGLKYQTMAEKGPKYCHKCTTIAIRGMLLAMLTVLFEFSGEHLLELSTVCTSFNTFVTTELDRRSHYHANMLAQRKPK